MSDITMFRKKMEAENLPEKVIQTFEKYYSKLYEGETGKLTKDQINPPSDKNITKYEKLKNVEKKFLEKLVVIKLNGGLGTSMGLKKAKSLLPIKDNFNFLDVIAKQILYCRKQNNVQIPLLLMDSFNTSKDSLEHLGGYENLKIGNLPLDFLQNKFPKIKRDNLKPLENLNDKLNWNPPGHGDIYISLSLSGILDKLLENGFEYAFISNSDNLGATLDEKILTYFADHNFPFLMETCLRTVMDKKGGHLAEDNNGRLLLRETAQCPESEIKEFQDTDYYKYFNTNNLWVNLKALKNKLEEHDNVLLLPLIINPKEVEGEQVYQLETAMGSAISVFENSQALVVPRTRFVPVKKTHDLFRIWSDAYELKNNFQISLSKECKEEPQVELDKKYFKTIDQLNERVKETPSLKRCKCLKVIGDCTFDQNVEFGGKVKIITEKKLRLNDIIIEN